MSLNLTDLVDEFANAQMAGRLQEASAQIEVIAASWPRVADLLRAVQTHKDGSDSELLNRLPNSIANPKFAPWLTLLTHDLEFKLGQRKSVSLHDPQEGQLDYSAEEWNSVGKLLVARARLYLRFGMAQPLAEIIEKLRATLIEDQRLAALSQSIGQCAVGLLQAEDTRLLKHSYSILFDGGPAINTHSPAIAGRQTFGAKLGQWLDQVDGEDLETRINWTRTRLLLLADETEKNEALSTSLIQFFGRVSDLSHVGALLMDKLSQQHPDNVALQFWYERSNVHHNVNKDHAALAKIQQKAMQSLETFELATRVAYHVPFAGIGRNEEVKLLRMMADSLPDAPDPMSFQKNQDDPVNVIFITAFSSNHGIAHVMHQFVGHLAEEGVEYTLINDGTVSEGDLYQQRIFGHAANVINITGHSDPFVNSEEITTEIQEAIDFIEAYEPDAIIHLDGFMNLNLANVLMRRLSPLNIYWIGHGGNLGLNFVDYIINDPFTADQAVTDIELEKEIRLPSAFATSGVFEFDDTLSKTDFGFAEDTIVINAFNNHMKINKAYLDALVRVLEAVPKAVLWFNEAKKRNTVWSISNYLKSKGIDSSRFTFASRVEPKSKHYARLHVSDFAMDTFTVCMASGTLDNMWAELPVISMPGDRYTNRTAGSFNRVMGLDCLNTQSIEEYVELAIELATNADKLARIKNHLKTYKRQTSMFDGAKFAQEVAAGLHAAVARSRQNLKPANINVPPIFEPIPEFG